MLQARITCISRKILSIETLTHIKYLTYISVILTAMLERRYYHCFTGEETRVWGNLSRLTLLDRGHHPAHLSLAPGTLALGPSLGQKL